MRRARKRWRLEMIAYSTFRKHGYPKADSEESAKELVTYVIIHRDEVEAFFHTDDIEELVERSADCEWGIPFNGIRRYPTKETEL